MLSIDIHGYIQETSYPITENMDIECDSKEIIIVQGIFEKKSYQKVSPYHIKRYLNYVEDEEGKHYRLLSIEWKNIKEEKKKNKDEESYLGLLKEILYEGDYRKTRNGFTYSLFGKTLTFDLKNQFPLLTTKKMFFRGVIEELLFFLRGETNSKKLEEKGVNIWKGNTTKAFIENRGLNYEEGDMGPMYGFNWRHFGTEYLGMNHNYKGEGFDQFSKLLGEIKKDPMSRRLIMTTYDPITAEEGVLYPCHGIVTQFYIREEEDIKYVSCETYLRSNDMFLGSPFNIASYAAFTYIICQYLGEDYKPDKLVMNIGDAHIYEEHIKQSFEQIGREPHPFPQLKIKPFEKIEDLTFEDFELINYTHEKTITAQMKA